MVQKWVRPIKNGVKGEKLEDWVTYKFRKEFGLFIQNERRINEDDSERVTSPRSKKVQTVGVVFAGKLGTLLAVKEEFYNKYLVRHCDAVF